MNVLRRDCECCASPGHEARAEESRKLVAMPGANTGVMSAAVITASAETPKQEQAIQAQNKKNPLPAWVTYAMLLFCIVSWASTYTAVKVAVAYFEPHHIACLRFVVASLSLAIFLPKAKVTMPSRMDVVRLLAYGLTGVAVYNVLLCTAEKTVNAGTASFVIGTAPVFASVIATFYLKEKLSRSGWIALAVAFVGAAIMSAGKGGGFAMGLDVLGLLVAAFLSAVSLTLQKSLLNRLSPLTCSIFTAWAGTLLLLPFLPGALEAAKHVPMSAVLCVVYLGVVPVGIGTICWSFVMAHTSVGRAAAFLYLVPTVAAVLSAVLLRELPSAGEITGGLVIMLAVLSSSPIFKTKVQALANVLGESMRTKPLIEECAE